MTAIPGKRRALGRGLEALIPTGGSHDSGGSSGSGSDGSGGGSGGSGSLGAAAGDRIPGFGRPSNSPTMRDYYVAPIEEIHPSPTQPRRAFDEAELEQLAQSIRAEGIIQPLIVRQRPNPDGGGYYIIAGERRWRAAQRAGLHDVPVVIREASADKAFELALIENLQRADLNPLEIAEAYQHLSSERGLTQEQIAERVGKDRTSITNILRLLKLPPSVRAMVEQSSLSMGHARALLALESAQAIEALALRVAARKLSVRATEELVRRQKDGPDRPTQPAKSAAVRDLEHRLTRSLGTRVQVNERGPGKSGRIEIQYANLDELDRLLDMLLGLGHP
ncbi:MAG: ParB/RepB/Spo0J family partition protein [Pseudomonadota bacterium]